MLLVIYYLTNTQGNVDTQTHLSISSNLRVLTAQEVHYGYTLYDQIFKNYNEIIIINFKNKV